MDFYNYKMHVYAKNKSDLPMEERMFSAKLYAEEQAQNEYDNIKELYTRTLSAAPISGHMSISSGRMAAAIYQDMLVDASNKLARIQGQSVVEYFEDLEKQETIAIENYTENKIAEYAETSRELTRLNKNKGISAKLTNFFGQGEQRVTELSQEMDVLCEQYSVAQDSTESWSYMTQNERMEYLLGRSEVDKITSFDQNGIDTLGKSLSLMRRQGEFAQDVSMAVTTISFEE